LIIKDKRKLTQNGRNNLLISEINKPIKILEKTAINWKRNSSQFVYNVLKQRGSIGTESFSKLKSKLTIKDLDTNSFIK